MKPMSVKQKSTVIKLGLYAIMLLSALGCTISGVNTNIFDNSNVVLHPCAIAVANLKTVSPNLPDGPVAVSTYEGDSNTGAVYIWKSCRAFLSSAPLTSGGRVQNTPTTMPDYQITGITDPEGMAYDTSGNLYIASTSPTPTSIYYVNMSALANLATADPTTGIQTIPASSLQTIPIPVNPVMDPAHPSDAYGQPRGLAFDADDKNLYVVMENYYGSGGGSTVLQITTPLVPATRKIYGVGNTITTLNESLGLAYSSAHQCFFVTDLAQKIHQLTWPAGTGKKTTGVSLTEATPYITLNGVYGFDVGVSVDLTSQDSVFFTTSNALATSGDQSNPNPACYLNSIAYNQWANYANGTTTINTVTLDPPVPYPASFGESGLLVAWGVGVFPYESAGSTSALHGIIVADAPKSKVVRFLEQ